ncbi:MAG: alpha/beta hydrolase [Pseudomonadota bacterium]
MKLRKSLTLFTTLATTFVLSACTTLSFYAANTKNDLSEVDVQKNIKYGKGARQRYDVYVPKVEPLKGSVIFFYGGGWRQGEKNQYTFVADRLTSMGYEVFIPDYTLYPEQEFPHFIEDSAAAVAHITRKNPDKKFVLMGHSAGAYNAAMLLADKKYLQQQDATSENIQAFIGLAGPYDFIPTSKKYQLIFQSIKSPKEMHVSTFIDGTEPTFFLYHGAEDGTVSPFYSHRLAKTIQKRGGQVYMEELSDINHINIMSSFSERFRTDLPEKMFGKITSFMNAPK